MQGRIWVVNSRIAGWKSSPGGGEFPRSGPTIGAAEGIRLTPRDQPRLQGCGAAGGRTSVRHFSELISTTTNSPGFWGLRADDLVYGGGVIGRDRRTGELAADAAGQADAALAIIEAGLREYGADLAAV